MTAVGDPVHRTAQGLSCYTANLAVYLAREDPDAVDRVARSVHLAVRPEGDDELTFSHHATAMHRVGEDELAWAWSTDPGEVLAELDVELDVRGAVLVLTDTGGMPWSLAPLGEGAPHLVLVDAHRDGHWHVVDRFAAVLPQGDQEPYDGWVDDATLLAATTPRHGAPPEHARRTTHAFGPRLTAPPPGAHGWLRRRPTPGPVAAPREEGWLTGPEEALPFLTAYFGELGDRPERARFLDDLWAASQHHVFRHTHLVDPRIDDTTRATAVEAWRSLPAALRFAADSAVRGRPRPSVVTTSFTAVLEAERAATTSTKENP